MPSPTSVSSAITVTTTIALIEQFLSNLSPNASHDGTPSTTTTNTNTPSPLLLLSASVRTLKAQVTKLSLLTVTTPFAPSAIATCLRPLNESVLPSLVTAALLTTPATFTEPFANECHALAKALLRELLALTRLVETRSKDKQPSKELPDAKRKEITEATGRVWENCDETVTFAEGDLPGFVVRKSKQWLELMKDAVKELTEWDPEEEVGPDDIFGDIRSDDDGSNNADGDAKNGSADRATISAGVKDQTLKVLSRIPQSIHVVIKQRLDKINPPSAESLPASTKQTLETVLKKMRNVSELIDESAEGMYIGDLELCLKKAGEARAEALEIVVSVTQPFVTRSGEDIPAESQEDKYINRALEWLKQVNTSSKAG